MNKTFSTLKFFIGWPLALLAIIFLVKLTLPNFSIVMEKITQINTVFVLLSIMIFLCYYLLRSYLWKMILEFKGYKIPLKKTAYLWEISEFKRYVPGNVWSFLSRVSLFSDIGVDKKQSGLALLDEIQLLIISSAFISLFSLPLMLYSNGPNSLLTQIKIVIIFSLLAVLIYSFAVAMIFKMRGNKNFIKNLFLPGYSLKEKLYLFLIAMITYFTFGAATLISCLSIFQFDARFYFELSAFFTFAFLAGYLSFITPMGLGVREGVITLGLERFTSLSTSGLLSIFSRIVLIISEMIYLLLVFALKILDKQKK